MEKHAHHHPPPLNQASAAASTGLPLVSISLSGDLKGVHGQLGRTQDFALSNALQISRMVLLPVTGSSMSPSCRTFKPLLFWRVACS